MNVGFALIAGTFLFLLGWDLIVGGLTLQSHFYGSYLLIGQSLVVIGCVALLMGPEEAKTIRAALPLLSILAITVFVALTLQPQISAWSSAVPLIWGGIAGLLALTTLLCIWRVGRAAIWGLFCVTLLVGIVNADTRRIFTFPGKLQSKDLYGHLFRIKQTIEGMNLHGRRVMLWLDRSEYTTGSGAVDPHFIYDFYYQNLNLRLNFYDSLAGFWLWDRGTLNFEMPTLHQYNREWLERAWFPTTVVLVCIYPETCERGREVLDRAGIATRVRARTLVGYPNLAPVTLLALDYDPPRSDGVQP